MTRTAQLACAVTLGAVVIGAGIWAATYDGWEVRADRADLYERALSLALHTGGNANTAEMQTQLAVKAVWCANQLTPPWRVIWRRCVRSADTALTSMRTGLLPESVCSSTMVTLIEHCGGVERAVWLGPSGCTAGN